jgi:hypothetical protein
VLKLLGEFEDIDVVEVANELRDDHPDTPSELMVYGVLTGGGRLMIHTQSANTFRTSSVGSSRICNSIIT